MCQLEGKKPRYSVKCISHKGTFISENELKKGTLKMQKSQIVILVLNQSPHGTIFAIVQFLGSTKFVLSGDPLYLKLEFWSRVSSISESSG